MNLLGPIIHVLKSLAPIHIRLGSQQVIWGIVLGSGDATA